MTGAIGKIKKDIIDALGLSVSPGTPILIGQSNITHMMNSHPIDYALFSPYIREILDKPDYVGINPGDNSIEYVKDFSIAGVYVKVAVRVAHSGNYYARSLYMLNKERVHNFIANGTLKKP
jgi:hypothetical protein